MINCYLELLSPKIISLAEHKVGFIVQFGADLAKAAVTATALETVLVPKTFHGFQ